MEELRIFLLAMLSIAVPTLMAAYVVGYVVWEFIDTTRKGKKY